MRRMLFFAAAAALGFAIAATAPAHAQPTAAIATDRAAWRAEMSALPRPVDGCFTASYPELAWKKTGCVAAPLRPYAPRGPAGRTSDWVAVAASGPITQASGGFSGSDLKREQQCHRHKCSADTYSIQLNSGYFHSSVCGRNKYCWQQFIYSSSPGTAFVQYWLLDRRDCPKGWRKGSYAFGRGCWKNSEAVAVPAFPLPDLDNAGIQATAANGAVSILFESEDRDYLAGASDLLDLAANWRAAQFNVLGDGGRSEARFNRGAAITVILTLEGPKSVTCQNPGGYSAETNNLTLENDCNENGTQISYDESRPK